MLKEEHDHFLDLIVKYYNCRESWLDNNTRLAAIEYRKTLKELVTCCRDMMVGIQEIQAERRKETLRVYKEKGYVPKTAVPSPRPKRVSSDT
jgi:hypothetical protein